MNGVSLYKVFTIFLFFQADHRNRRKLFLYYALLFIFLITVLDDFLDLFIKDLQEFLVLYFCLCQIGLCISMIFLGDQILRVGRLRVSRLDYACGQFPALFIGLFTQ